jgi:hypothetical protein
MWGGVQGSAPKRRRKSKKLQPRRNAARMSFN